MNNQYRAVDMHCDTISGIWKAAQEGCQLALRTNDMHIDLQKLRKGGYLLQNFAMFVFKEDGRDPLVSLLELIDTYYTELRANADLLAPVLKFEDIAANDAAGKLSALLTMEEGAPLKGNPAILRMMYELGVRMIALTWNFENEIGYPNTVVRAKDYDPSKKYGLKEAGIEIVREMNRLGMIVDVSHLSDDGFWDVVKYCDAPFVASHSNSRAMCSHTRNMTDEMIRALADKGGVMGINFCGEFLNPNGSSRAQDMVRHIQHIRDVGGVDCIGLGTDYDGIGGKLEISNASEIGKLAAALEKAGFHEREIEAIFSENVLRVYREVLK